MKERGPTTLVDLLYLFAFFLALYILKLFL